MQVRVVRMVRGGYGAFEAGQSAELPDDVAARWIAAGVAEPVGSVVPTESATVMPEESAMVRRPRGRTH